MKNLIPIVFTALTFTPLAHAESTISPVFEKDANSVVRIFAEGDAKGGFDVARVRAVGSGFHLSNGYIATAPRVIAGLDNILVFEAVKGEDGGMKYYVHRADPLAFDQNVSAGILKCADMHSPGLTYAKAAPQNGDAAYNVGFNGTNEDEKLIAVVAQAINPTWDKYSSWDITDVVQNARLLDAFLCVRQDGRVQNSAMGTLKQGTAGPSVILTDIPHEDGMGGCPLLNADGQLEGLELGREFTDEPGDETPQFALSLTDLDGQLRKVEGVK